MKLEASKIEIIWCIYDLFIKTIDRKFMKATKHLKISVLAQPKKIKICTDLIWHFHQLP